MPNPASCGALFNSLLIDSDDLKEVSSKVEAARTVDEIDRIVTDGTNIDASRTVWFESVGEPGVCQAQVYLQTPDKDGNNTAYVGFEIRGFLPAESIWIQGIVGDTVLESVRVNRADVRWFRE